MLQTQCIYNRSPPLPTPCQPPKQLCPPKFKTSTSLHSPGYSSLSLLSSLSSCSQLAWRRRALWLMWKGGQGVWGSVMRVGGSRYSWSLIVWLVSYRLLVQGLKQSERWGGERFLKAHLHHVDSWQGRLWKRPEKSLQEDNTLCSFEDEALMKSYVYFQVRSHKSLP